EDAPMLNPILTKAYDAGADVAGRRIVKFSTDTAVVQGAAATDALIGVSTSLSAESGERVDVIRVGIAEVDYGGNVTRGDPLTSDASGKAVKATAGSGVRVIGTAE